MVIRDFYVKGIPIPPDEAHAILIVNPNAVLPRPIPAKRFQMISRRHLQVIERDGRIQNRQFLERPAPEISRKSPALARPPQPFGFLVAETRDHSLAHYFVILTRHDTTVKQ